MHYKKTNYLLVSLLSCLLSACMSSAPAPQDHYYRLDTGKKDENLTSYQLPYKVIGIPPAIAEGLYRERSILHIDSATPLELQQYHYYHWHDAPANLIQEHLISRLQQAVPQTRFAHLQRGDQEAVILQARILRFEREHTPNGATVLVKLEMKLDRHHQVLFKQQYQQSVATTGDSMYDTIEAFGTALNHIYDHFLQDVSH